MIGAFAALAGASPPPRGELVVGYGGNGSQSYGMIIAQPAIVRGGDAGLSLRLSATQLHYTFLADGTEHVVSGPGLSVGPTFVVRPGDLTLGFSVGLGARASTERAPTGADRDLFLQATFAVDAAFRPSQRAQITGALSLDAGAHYLWGRIGAMHPVLSMIRPQAPVDLWLGVEATTSGTFETRRFEIGPVADFPVRPWNASFALRTAVAVARDAGDGQQVQATAGVGLYWAY